ncbi:hypothetical protein SO694_00013463 [Aureococcus anophagefferens]|uniref:Armadillo repeat-containing domain-containing protein n=1 Tax=Aureococcus anophagefferens TaxID=44056 RepID=A0ABR1G228_AURAN
MAELIARHVRALRGWGDRRYRSKRNAARALRELSFDDDNHDLIAEAGGIPVLIDFLRDESFITDVQITKCKSHVMFTLSNLACTDAYKILIVEARAALIDLLRDGGEVATQAARALGNLERDAGAIKDLPRPRCAGAAAHRGFVEAREALVELQGAANGFAQHAALALGNLAFGNDTCAALIAEAGAIPALVDILRGGVTSDAKWEAALSLGNLACRDDNRVRIAEAGGVPVLLGLLRDGSAEVKPDVAYSLENLALGNDANAVAIARSVGPGALVELARRGRVTVGELSVVRDAGDHAKREAALCVAALDGVLGRVPDVVRAIIESYLWRS